MTGQTVSHYQILEKLGEGGMGVVYKARDTRLDRMVALKVLPIDISADPERRARFEREARAVSALNHPHIVTLYDIDSVDEVLFFTMEYVAGISLAQMIRQRRIDLPEALDYAAQVAGALAAAHAAGIVHRDLKPANIVVTEKGVAKVLDFGLSKLTGASKPGPDESTISASPTTRLGSAIGTIPYMSPEQAQGKSVDARSDIFSFGVTLYELVTRRRPFDADSDAGTLGAILHQPPQSLEKFELPADLKKIILRCLQKDPERRFQSAADIRVELLELKDSRDTSVASPVMSPSRRRARLYLAGAAVAVAAAVCAALWYFQRQQPSTTANLQSIPLTSFKGYEISPALSPDGKQVAFSWNGNNEDNYDIYVKLVSGGSPLRITKHTATETAPAWSPDASQIAFIRTNPDPKEPAGVFVTSAYGEGESRVADCENDSSPQEVPWIAWAPDGKSIAFRRRGSPDEPPGIFQVFLDTGERRRLTKPPATAVHGDRMFAFSPDGRRLVFSRFFIGQSADLFLMELTSSSEPKRLTTRLQYISGLGWLPGGREVLFSGPVTASSYAFGRNFLSDAVLWKVSADGVPAPPNQIPLPQGPVGRFSVARSGQFVYERAMHDTNLWLLDNTKTGISPGQIGVSTQAEIAPQFSADSWKLAFASDRSGALEIWIDELQGSPPIQLTKLSKSSHSPRWSPDGRRIVFSSLADGYRDLFIMNADGSSLRRLTSDEVEQGRPSFSRDGRFVYHYVTHPRNQNIWKVPVDGGSAVQVTRNGGHEAFESPDGSTVYYTKGPLFPDERTLFAHPLNGGEDTRVLDGVRDGYWSVTRDGICYVDLLKGSGEPPLNLQFWEFKTKRIRQIHTVLRPLILANPSFSASWDASRIAWSQVDQVNSDLMLIQQLK